MKYIQPAVKEKLFTCPHCILVSAQSLSSRNWKNIYTPLKESES